MSVQAKSKWFATLKWVGCFCLASAMYAGFQSVHSGDVAFSVGENVPVVGVLTLVYWKVRRDESLSLPTAAAFVAFMVCAVATDFAFYAKNANEARAALKEAAAVVRGEPAPAQIQSSQGANELSAAVALVRQAATERDQFSSRFDAALEGAGCVSMLEPKQYPGNAPIEPARKIAASCLALVDSFRREDEKRMVDYKAKFESLPFSPKVRKEAQESFAQSFPRAIEAQREQWGASKEFFISGMNLIDFLADHRSSWSAKGDKFLFSNELDLAGYQALYGVYQKAAARLVELSNAQEARAQEVAKTIEQSVK